MSPQRSGPKTWWTPRDWAEEQALRVVKEVHRLRGSNSAQWLADQTKELGHEVTRSVIADLENGRRRYVTIPELIVLSYALGTVPAALLFPAPYDEEVEVWPGMTAPKFVAAEAFCGNPDGLAFVGPQRAKALQHARAIASAKSSQQLLLEMLATAHEAFADDHEKRERYSTAVRAQLETVNNQLKALEAEDGG